MSSFEVSCIRLSAIEPHPNADKLDLAAIGGYRAIVGRGAYTPGDLVIYIPTDAVIPAERAEALGVAGYLAGPKKDRVKAIKLRGVLSEGIVLPAAAVPGVQEGEDVAERLGITKYEEPERLGTQPSGSKGAPPANTRPWPEFVPQYDIEALKKFNRVLKPGEEVVVTEKLHGSNIAVAIAATAERAWDQWVCSRKLAWTPLGEGDDYRAEPNDYWRTVKKHDLLVKACRLAWVAGRLLRTEVTSLSLHGEVVGVQDLRYGASTAEPIFQAFDICVNGQYVDHDVFEILCEQAGVPMVPVLYRGPFDFDAVVALADGNTTLPVEQIREGVVVKAATERYEPLTRRAQLKVISGAYLTRKGGTEFH